VRYAHAHTLHKILKYRYIPARQGNVITVESAVALSVMLFGNSSDISTDLFAEDCVTVLLVSMLGAGVDSFCLAVED